MKAITLTLNKVAIVDDDIFEMLRHLRWFAMPCKHTYYAGRTLILPDGRHRTIRMHHMVSGYPIRGFQTDHINGDGLDNRRANLRVVTRRENTSNKICHRNGKKTSRFVGVCLHKTTGKWGARIRMNGAYKHLGLFKTEEEASEAYRQNLKIVKNSDHA